MSERLLILLAVALLLAAGGLWLWHLSARERERALAAAHLDRQLAASQQAVDDAPWLRGTESFDADEGAAVGRTQPAADSPLLAFMPSWMAGAVAPGQLMAAGIGSLLITLLVGLLLGPVGAGAVLVICAVLCAFWVWLSVQRFRRLLVRQLPAFIDGMVRLITIGNSTQAAFQLSVPSAAEPLRHYLERASSLVRGGEDLDKALYQMAETVDLEEMFLLSAILGLGVRYGGRADLLLERVANFMRDREQAEQELKALSAETRLSAWVLGVLPIAVGGFIIMLNAGYFMRMWQDETGRLLIFGAAGLQVLGVFLLYRLAKL